MLHLYNSYFIGYTGLGEDKKGVFININLLELVNEKENSVAIKRKFIIKGDFTWRGG